MNFRALQNMTRKQPRTKNYAYWDEPDWLDAEWYTDAPVNPVARFAAGDIARRMRAAIRKGNVKPFR